MDNIYLNKDSLPDLILSGYSNDGDGFLLAFLNEGNGSFNKLWGASFIKNPIFWLKSFDKDGNRSIVFTGFNNKMYLFSLTSDGLIATKTYYDLPSQATSFWAGSFGENKIICLGAHIKENNSGKLRSIIILYKYDSGALNRWLEYEITHDDDIILSCVSMITDGKTKF